MGGNLAIDTKPKGEKRAAPRPSTRITPQAAETVAIRSVIVALVDIVDQLAPASLDRELATTRVRLQQIEGARTPEKFPGEHLVLRTRIDILEQGLGRVFTQA